MLQIKDLTITHRKDLRIILEKFSMVLNDGDKAVIIGEEGNGKSTLMKWIYDPELTEDYTECEGEMVTKREVLGYLPQELPEADKAKTLYEYFSEAQLFYDKYPNLRINACLSAFQMSSSSLHSVIVFDVPFNHTF